MGSSWTEFTLEAPAEVEEDLAAALCESGALGVKVEAAPGPAGGAVRLRAFFEPGPGVPALGSVVRDLGGLHGARVIGVAGVEDGRWVERWVATLAPFDVGRRFTIVPVVDPDRPPAPGRSRPTADADRIVIRICPSRAFGTGEHPTTRLCLEALESERTAGASVIDVGTGSGILAIAARLLGCRRAVAIDNDAEAIAVAASNVRLNPAASPIALVCGEPASLRGGSFDLVVANLNGAILGRVLHALAARLALGGTLILSGILDEEAEEVSRSAEDLGARRIRVERRDGWVCTVHRAE